MRAAVLGASVFFSQALFYLLLKKNIIQAYPGQTEDSLVRRASQSLRTSQELQSKGNDLKATVRKQLGDLEEQQRALGTTKGILDITDSRINALNTLMDTQFTTGEFAV